VTPAPTPIPTPSLTPPFPTPSPTLALLTPSPTPPLPLPSPTPFMKKKKKKKIEKAFFLSAIDETSSFCHTLRINTTSYGTTSVNLRSSIRRRTLLTEPRPLKSALFELGDKFRVSRLVLDLEMQRNSQFLRYVAECQELGIRPSKKIVTNFVTRDISKFVSPKIPDPRSSVCSPLSSSSPFLPSSFIFPRHRVEARRVVLKPLRNHVIIIFADVPTLSPSPVAGVIEKRPTGGADAETEGADDQTEGADAQQQEESEEKCHSEEEEVAEEWEAGVWAEDQEEEEEEEEDEEVESLSSSLPPLPAPPSGDDPRELLGYLARMASIEEKHEQERCRCAGCGQVYSTERETREHEKNFCVSRLRKTFERRRRAEGVRWSEWRRRKDRDDKEET